MLAVLALALTSGIPSLVEALPSKEHSKHGFNWDSIQHLITFGDSYTFVQGTNGYPGYSFIGDQLNYAYDAEMLLTDKIVQNQTGTSAGGPNWVEYLTGCGLKEGLTAPVSCTKQLWDFAFAGAGVSAEYIPLHHPFTISFVNQITQYTTYGHPVLTSISSPKHPRPKTNTGSVIDPSSTLIAVWIGINDINDSAAYNLTTSFPSFYSTLINAIYTSLQDLSSLGYKKFVILNLPPLDRTPTNQDRVLLGKSALPNATQVEWFNSALDTQSQDFERQNPETSALVFNAHKLLSGILDDPRKYGILNTTDFCPGAKEPDIESNYEKYGCPTPLETYFWYDSGHITSKVHEELARALDTALRK